MSEPEGDLFRQASTNPLNLKILIRLSKKSDHLMEIGRSLNITNTYELMNASKNLKDLGLIEQKAELEGRRFYQVTDAGKRVAAFAHKEQDQLVKAESKLAETLWNMGWACLRSPAGATGHTPDMVAIKGTDQDRKIIVLRCAGSSANATYVEASQIDALRTWKDKADAKVYVAVTFFPNGEFSFLEENQLGSKSETGIFSISPETAASGANLESLFA